MRIIVYDLQRVKYILKIIYQEQQMTRLSLEQIKDLLQDINLTKVAEGAGVQYQALTRLANGTADDPSYDLVVKVGKYLEERFAAVKGD